MDTRREFIKKATLLSGMVGMNALIPASIQKALAIDPKPGSYLDGCRTYCDTHAGEPFF